MKLAFIGVGKLGRVLAERFSASGHEIIVAHDNAESSTVKAIMESHPSFWYFPLQDAVDRSDVVFFAVPFDRVENAIQNLYFDDKILIDCTNPIDSNNRHAMDGEVSGSEYIQLMARDAQVVKAFSIHQADDYLPLHQAHYKYSTMLIASDSEPAKSVVASLTRELDFEPLDVGGLEQALHLEHLAMLYNGMLQNDEKMHLKFFFSLV